MLQFVTLYCEKRGCETIILEEIKSTPILIDLLSRKIYNNRDKKNTLDILIKHRRKRLMSIIDTIKKRIEDMQEGEIMLTSDFADLSSFTTIRKCLGRCTDQGLIRRVMDGVYEKPKFSKLLNEFVPTDPEKVAYALAKTYHWSIAPCGDIALNKLGLTTQVPVVWIYVSDGPYRKFAWENIQLEFKHKTNKEISQLSKQTVLLIEAVRALGKDRITDNDISKMQERISVKDKKTILKEATASAEWIYETIRKVCACK